MKSPQENREQPRSNKKESERCNVDMDTAISAVSASSIEITVSVNLPLNIKGVNISALFTEKKEHVRVSLRSVNDFSVNRLARLHFNGGGHERASGGKLFMNIADAGSFFEKSLEMSFNHCINSDNIK